MSVEDGSQHPDTNGEHEDVELPFSSQDELTSVVLYGSWASPPCAKIRAVLGFYGVQYSNTLKAKPNSSYQKMPVLDLNDLQVNDSYVMVKALAPLLQGEPLSPLELEIEELSTYGLMLAMEHETAGSCGATCSCACTGICKRSCFTGCLLGCLACCVCCCVAPKMRRTFEEKAEKYSEKLLSSAQYGALFGSKLGEQQYYHGDTPGIEDAALYGMILSFEIGELPCCEAFFQDKRMAMWWERMSQIESLSEEQVMRQDIPI